MVVVVCGSALNHTLARSEPYLCHLLAGKPLICWKQRLPNRSRCSISVVFHFGARYTPEGGLTLTSLRQASRSSRP